MIATAINNLTAAVALSRAAILLLFVLLAELVAATDAREVFKAVAPSVVLIKTYASGRVPLKIGSGFFVAPGDALVTNAHVIAGASEVECVLSNGVTISVTEVLALAADKDIAILSAKGPALQLSERIPEVGESIFALGNPKGLSATFSNGIVSALRSQGGMPVIQITAPISPGSSGGPVVDDKGRVIGVASFNFREGQNLNFAVGSSAIIPMLAARNPMPIAVAGYKADEAAKQNAATYGQDRLTVVRKSLKGERLSVSIKNNETSAVYHIVMRVLFYEDGRQAKLAENQSESVALRASLAKGEHVEKLLQIRSILDKNFNYWTSSEIAILGEFDSSVNTYPNSVRRTPNPSPSWTDIALENIAKTKLKVEKELGNSANETLVARQGDIRAKLAKLDSERRGLNGPVSSDDLLLIDYKDYVLEHVIAPGLTKSFEVQGSDALAKPTIVDFALQVRDVLVKPTIVDYLIVTP